MPTCKPTDEGKRLIRAMARAQLEMGATDAHAVIDAIHEGIRDFAPMDKGEIAAIVGGFEDIPKAKATRSELQERLTQLRRELRAEFGPGRPEAVAAAKNARRQNEIRKQIAKLDEQIKTGDFRKETRPKPEYDEETLRLQADLERSRAKADWEERQIEFRHASPVKRAATFAASLYRASILAGISVFEHLAGASAWRLVSTLFEDAFWSGARHFPGLKNLDERALIEGGGFEARAHLAGLRDTFSAQTLRDMRDKMTKGASDRQILYGGKLEHQSHFPLLDVIGHSHDAIKTPLERYAYARAYVRGNKNLRKSLARQGKDADAVDRSMATDSAQAMLNLKAYEESQAAKLQGNNRLVNEYNALLKKAEASGDFGALVAGLARIETPILKIPFNYAAESFSYFPLIGTAKAISKSRSIGERVARGGVEMTSDEADYIVRQIKKQGVGAGAAAIGFFSYLNFGGLWRPGHGPSNPKVATGDVKVGDTDITHHWTHSPFENNFQMGATVAYIMREDAAKAAKDKRADSPLVDALDGLGQAATAMLLDVPVFDLPKDIGKMAAGQWRSLFGEKARGFIPAEIGRQAKEHDLDAHGKPVKRKPSTFAQELEMSIPGHGIGPIPGRLDVPIEKPKHKKSE
jgi:hypothetical protein